MPITPVLERWRKDQEFKGILNYETVWKMKTKNQTQKHMVNIHLMGNGDGLVGKSARCGLTLDP